MLGARRVPRFGALPLVVETMLTCNIDSFYFTEEELQQSPSRAHGITQEQEGVLRVYGAQMVQEAGILLKCPQVVMATGQILLQRFYCKRSLKDFSIKVRACVRACGLCGTGTRFIKYVCALVCNASAWQMLGCLNAQHALRTHRGKFCQLAPHT